MNFDIKIIENGLLLRVCWQGCANGCNNSQQCWDLRCILGRIQPISLCKSWVMSLHGPNNVGRVVQTVTTLLRYASAITEQRKCWELLAKKLTGFNFLQQHATTSNNIQQGVQTDATCNIQPCWELLVNNVASVCTQPEGLKDTLCLIETNNYIFKCTFRSSLFESVPLTVLLMTWLFETYSISP